MTFAPANAQAAYLPIEFDLPDTYELASEIISARNRLLASVINVKEIGQYETVELITAQQWFSIEPYPSPRKPRYAYRKVYDIVEITQANVLAGATVVVPHNIPKLRLMTRMFGSATTITGIFLPLPYASATANLNIEIFADATSITVINGAGQPDLSQCYIVLEYIKR